MCTAVTYKTRDFYFGRTLDYDVSYIDEVTITPRKYPFHFRNMGTVDMHHAMIGMAYVLNGYPLYYDAVNEKGLGIAGLNFTGNAVYGDVIPGKDNIAQFELIPWILGQCSSVKEVRKLLKKMQLVDIPFCEDMPIASLHWLIADCREAITVEAVKEGIRIYQNPVGVLTNNPPFPEQMFRLNDYMHLSPADPQNLFLPGLGLEIYSRGMGALGLPGDLSSQSRFVRAVFTKMHAVSGDSETESISQFFHILGSVEQQRGCCEVCEAQAREAQESETQEKRAQVSEQVREAQEKRAQVSEEQIRGEQEKRAQVSEEQIRGEQEKRAQVSEVQMRDGQEKREQERREQIRGEKVSEQVSGQKGSEWKTKEKKYEITIYTSCCNATRGIYYYTTYDNHQITAVDMHRENLEGSCLIRYPLICKEQINFQNSDLY